MRKVYCIQHIAYICAFYFDSRLAAAERKHQLSYRLESLYAEGLVHSAYTIYMCMLFCYKFGMLNTVCIQLIPYLYVLGIRINVATLIAPE